MLSKPKRESAKSSSNLLVLLYVCGWKTTQDLLNSLFLMEFTVALISVGWWA